MFASELEKNVKKAELCWERSDFVRAKDIYLATLRERLIFVADRGQKFIAADLFIIERLADLALLFGDFSAADDLLSSLTMLCEDAENFWVADYARLKRIHLALGNARLFEVRRIFAEMSPRIGELSEIEFSPEGLKRWENSCSWRDANKADRAVLLAILMLEMGRTLCCLGQYLDALAVLEQGQTHTLGKDQPELAQQMVSHFLLAVASAQLEKGETATAKKCLDKFAKGFPDAEIALQINHLELQTQLDLLRGELGEALNNARKLIKMCRTNSFERAAIVASINLANVLVVLNQTHLAEEILREAEDQFTIDSEVLRARIVATKGLARARAISSGDGVPIAPSVTEMWYEARHNDKSAAVEIAFNFLEMAQSDNFLTFFEERALGFQQTLGWRKLTDAQKILKWLQEVFEVSDSALIQNRLLVLEAMMDYYLQNYKRAATKFQLAETFFASQNLVPELWQLRRYWHWCQQHTGLDDVQSKTFAETTDKLLENMTASLAPEDRSAFLINKWTAEEEFIAGEINTIVELRAELAAASWWQRPARKWTLLKRLNRLLFYIDRHKHFLALSTRGGNGTENPFSKSLDENAVAQEISLWQRLTAPRKNSLTLVFLVLPDRTLIVKSERFSIDFRLSFITRLELRQMVKNWHLQMRQRAMLRAKETVVRGLGKASASNYDTKLSAVEELPEKPQKNLFSAISDDLQLTTLLENLPSRVKTLNIVPDDILYGFPFAAVTIKGQFLIEKYSLTINFENSLHKVRYSDSNRHAPLLIGSTGKGSSLGELAGIQSEIYSISEWCQTKFLQSPQILYGETSDKTMVLQAIRASSFLHIAGHGVFDSNNPQQSGLLLSEKDGTRVMLNLEDFFNLNLSSTQHITLSSCWSADHYILPGRWVVGLPETLWRAGAHSILGSIWFVDDEVAVSLMNNFYNNLSETTRSEALRRAQLACLKGELPVCADLDTKHPFFWAGFILYGATDKL